MSTAVAADGRSRSASSAALPTEGRRPWVPIALIVIMAVAAASYSWGIASQTPELYYAAAVRSMSMSWHNFFFAAFDPAATVSIDKLPGAFWLQALSVKLFGAHFWALILPQVIEGVLTIFLLFRVVRRLSGTTTAVLAAAVAACMPATVALNRGNISDTLLILLLVLAVDLAASAAIDDKPRNLMFAGFVVGVAFQAKMVQAWLLLPILALMWLCTTPKGALRIRLAWTAGMGAIAAVVSLSWLAVVTVVPVANRPYVDGSQHNSLFEQVFQYNASSRGAGAFDVGAANIDVGNGRTLRDLLVLGPDSRFDHVLGGGGGRMIGWLVPLALICLVWLSVIAWRQGRRDGRVVALVAWGSWLSIHLIVFLAVGTVNGYYLAALTPPIAALIAMGAVELGRVTDRRVLAIGAGLALATVVYGWWLLDSAPSAIRWITAAVGVVLCTAAVLLRGPRSAGLLLLGALVAPAVASASVVWDNFGPLDTPFESSAARDVTQKFLGDASRSAAPLVDKMQSSQGPGVYPFATYSSTIASPFIFATGAEILPIGGFTGTVPSPTVDQLTRIVAAGRVHLVLVTATTDDRVAWVRANCKALDPADSVAGVLPYYCGKPTPQK
ncbi:ArnT family glycosyltransferase [Antrihabitans cavernicola]|uniref:Uncharacterized protein n=1 Tax=Antrihabitans cavernicola TaxID=2495913 RepID=A0A5A7SHW7_9NOCA|nr:glycosyltransferase family 39 protein [Spelaeibacter cavernicola]KAA0024762.1 hypothetical protein FOY51_02165 [Spelaeibacter cavernicola]